MSRYNTRWIQADQSDDKVSGPGRMADFGRPFFYRKYTTQNLRTIIEEMASVTLSATPSTSEPAKWLLDTSVYSSLFKSSDMRSALQNGLLSQSVLTAPEILRFELISSVDSKDLARTFLRTRLVNIFHREQLRAFALLPKTTKLRYWMEFNNDIEPILRDLHGQLDTLFKISRWELELCEDEEVEHVAVTVITETPPDVVYAALDQFYSEPWWQAQAKISRGRIVIVPVFE